MELCKDCLHNLTAIAKGAKQTIKLICSDRHIGYQQTQSIMFTAQPQIDLFLIFFIVELPDEFPEQLLVLFRHL